MCGTSRTRRLHKKYNQKMYIKENILSKADE